MDTTRILPNGMRFLATAPTGGSVYSDACLIVPVGENHEESHQSQCAHICEHFCSAFNGGFSTPYSFLDLRTKYSIRFNISTHEDYTLYHVSHIPPDAIPEVVSFIQGVFRLMPPDPAAMRREIDIVKAENAGLTDAEGLVWSALYWARQTRGQPSIEAILHRGMPDGIEPSTVLAFHRQHYIPARCVLRIIRPERTALEWDRQLSSTLTSSSPMSFRPIVPVGAMMSVSDAGCAGCSVLQGAWMIPDKRYWMICTKFFPVIQRNYSDSEIRGRVLISSCTRLTGSDGSSTGENQSLIDYLRKQLAVSYSIKGEQFRMKHRGIEGTLVVFTAPLSRHLSRHEAARCVQIINNCRRIMPSRGDISNLLARFVSHTQPEIVQEAMKMARIPFVSTLNWDAIRRSYSTNLSSDGFTTTEGEISSIVFSTEES
jgi:hypothetical protein